MVDQATLINELKKLGVCPSNPYLLTKKQLRDTIGQELNKRAMVKFEFWRSSF